MGIRPVKAKYRPAQKAAPTMQEFAFKDFTAQAKPRGHTPEVTYREFSRLAKKHGWTVEMLVELFKGKTSVESRSDNFHERLATYFERVLSCWWLNPELRRMENRGDGRSFMEILCRYGLIYSKGGNVLLSMRVVASSVT